MKFPQMKFPRFISKRTILISLAIFLFIILVIQFIGAVSYREGATTLLPPTSVKKAVISQVSSLATTKPAAKITAPKITAPKITAPKITAPKITAPKITAPKITAPKITAPKITAPKITAPKITTPKPKSTLAKCSNGKGRTTPGGACVACSSALTKQLCDNANPDCSWNTQKKKCS